MSELSLPYVPIDPRIETHPKTRKFLRVLGKADDQFAHMHVVKFLMEVGKHHPDGNLGKLEPEDIADMARWSGDAMKFTAALCDSGWLLFGNGGYVVVGWDDYGGRVHAARQVFKDERKRSAHRRWHQDGKHQKAPVDDCPLCEEEGAETPQSDANGMQNDASGMQVDASQYTGHAKHAEPEPEPEVTTKPRSTPLAPPQKTVALSARRQPSELISRFESLPTTKNGIFAASDLDLEEWRAAYPGVDVLQALRTMRQWLLADRTRLKTQRGIHRFVAGWLSREQDRGRKTPMPHNGHGVVTRRGQEIQAAIAAASPDMFKRKPVADADQ